MYRCALAALIAFAAVCLHAPASAQGLRAFPKDTLRGTMVFVDHNQITLNGVQTQLAPGSRVRDVQNMIVVPGSLAGSRFLVHYTVEVGNTHVRDVWILRPEEAAIKPWPTTILEANTWVFDAARHEWIKP